jgi:mRNA (guanine-N7-)-methyltransferase
MSLPDDAPEWSFGNEFYKITFDERGDELPLYGQRYTFYLQDAVDNVPEYVVHWDHFVACVRAPPLPPFLGSTP